MYSEELVPIYQLYEYMYSIYSPYEPVWGIKYSLPVMHRAREKWFYRYFSYCYMDKDESILIPLEIITISVEDFDDFTRECVPKEMQKKFYIAKKEAGKEYCSYDELIILFDVIKNYYIKGRVVERKIILCYANWMKEYVEKDMLSFYYEIGREFMEWLDSYQKRLT